MLRKCALITGASGDIGRSIARTLSNNGYDLFLCAFKNEIDVKGLKTQVTQLRFDVSSAKQVQEAFDQLARKGVKFDLVVCNAGVAENEAMLIDKSDEEIDFVIKTNLSGTIYCNKYVLPLMNKGSSLINIASFLGVYGGSCEAVYSAAKAGVIGLTKALAKECAPLHVRVNCISPGFIDTKMNASFDETDRQLILENTPLKKFGTGDNVAQAVLYLAENDFVTGENLIVSGGLTV